MTYKRAARVAFFSADGALANAAARVAERVGGGWLVATAVACQDLEKHAARDGSLADQGQSFCGQQDLLVSLDEPARLWLAELALALPARHYGVDNLAPADQAQAIEQRVNSMVAGMRMLARGSD